MNGFHPHIAKLLADEHIAEVRRQHAERRDLPLRPSRDRPPTHRLPTLPRRRLHLPITARGVAELDD